MKLLVRERPAVHGSNIIVFKLSTKNRGLPIILISYKSKNECEKVKIVSFVL